MKTPTNETRVATPLQPRKGWHARPLPRKVPATPWARFRGVFKLEGVAETPVLSSAWIAKVLGQ